MICSKVIKPLPRKEFLFNTVLVALLIVVSILLSQFKLLKRWDNLVYDVETAMITNAASDNIVIATIDDISLKKLGRWPWSRAVHARFLDQLTAISISAIGFDILFMEPDLRFSEDDELLAEAIRKNGRVVLPVLTNMQEDSIMITKSLAQITDAAQLSHVNMNFDEQGVVRQLDLQIRLDDGQILPSMALALYQTIHDKSKLIDITNKETVLITFSNQFRRVSYVDVLLDVNLRKSLKGKVILVGVTAAGLGSNLATPGAGKSRLMSGVEFQANALNTLESGKIVLPVKWYESWLISIFLITFLVISYRFLKPAMMLVATLAFSLLACAISFVLLNVFQLWFAPLATVLCLIISYPLWSLHRLKVLKISLFKEHENASAILKAIEDSVVVVDKRGRIEYMNPSAEKMLGYTLKEAKTLIFSEIYKVVEQEDSMLFDNKALSDGGERKTEIQVIQNRYNEEYAVRFSSRPVYTESGLSEGVVFAFSDLTEMVNVSQKIAYLAAHDMLTGLPNRILLKNLMEQAIKNANREGVGFAILFIDLDGFKVINDEMGHASGDILLQEVAQRLKNWARESDTISRWGGDEFIVVLDKLISPADVADVAEQIKRNLSQVFVVNQKEVLVTPSIGISFFPDDGKDVDTLLEKADAAMYNVKENGQNNFCFYSQSLEAQAKERFLLETELRQALKEEAIEVYYQPQFDLTHDKLVGVEALIRWKHSTKGLLKPDQFLVLAEETGLIVPIGEWVISNVCQQLTRWKSIGFPLIKIAINLSARQFAQKNLVSLITQEFENYEISPKLLQIEITESMIIEDVDLVVEIIGNLKEVGVSIAIDDFGTGYSSFESLKKLSIDKIKIDSSFIGNLVNGHDDEHVVQAVISMCHEMNIEVIAEGVETEEQLKFLHEKHCDYAQGYFFSKPVSSDEIVKIIQRLSL